MGVSSVWACRGSFVAVRNPTRAPAGHERGDGPPRAWRASSGRAQVRLARAHCGRTAASPRLSASGGDGPARRVHETETTRGGTGDAWDDEEEGRTERFTSLPDKPSRDPDRSPSSAVCRGSTSRRRCRVAWSCARASRRCAASSSRDELQGRIQGTSYVAQSDLPPSSG